MRVLVALALLVGVIGGIVHFWPERKTQSVASPAPDGVSSRAARPALPSTLQQEVAPKSSPLPARAPQPATVAPASAVPVRIALHASDTARHGDNVLVSVDVKALRAMRRLEFAVTYEKSILRLLNSMPGALAQQGVSVHFEESSEGFVTIRIEVESGVIAVAGNVATLEFQARKPGESPLRVQDVTYAEYGAQDMANVPDLYERSITVD